jgi:lambda family phage portal protein
MSASWYNEERVGRKESVVLQRWNAERELQRKKVAAVDSKRMYAGAQFNRLTSDWTALNTSADSEILTSLRLLRARSRELVRDNAHAKNAIRIIQNNVVGTGVVFQAQVADARGKLLTGLNDAIEEEYAEWCAAEICHTGGKLHMPDLLRLVIAQVAEAGEVLIRKVRQPFGGGRTPLALEVLEADRLLDNWQTARAPNGNAIRMGVEVDQWGRPVAYWLYPTHPGDFQFRSFEASNYIRVPADDIIHLYLVERWPQTRGVPWFHTVLRRLNDMKGYGEAEIVAARASANIVGFIKAPEGPVPDAIDGNRQVMDAEPGTFKYLGSGEDFVGFNPSRPNAALEPFMRFMLREIGAGVGVSYESLSRDYSQSNYSASRLSLLDDRDLWRVLQGWLIRNLCAPIKRDWLSASVLAGVVNIPDFYSKQRKYQRDRWKPRGWSWIDPTKEVTAYKMAVRAGFMSASDVIAQTNGGADIEDVYKSRRAELDMAAEMGLVFDTDPAMVDEKDKAVDSPAEPAPDPDSPEANESDVEPPEAAAGQK